MKNPIIVQRRLGIGEEKDIQNHIAMSEKATAIMDYIAACDYPEILDDDSEVTEDEEDL